MGEEINSLTINISKIIEENSRNTYEIYFNNNNPVVIQGGTKYYMNNHKNVKVIYVSSNCITEDDNFSLETNMVKDNNLSFSGKEYSASLYNYNKDIIFKPNVYIPLCQRDKYTFYLKGKTLKEGEYIKFLIQSFTKNPLVF